VITGMQAGHGCGHHLFGTASVAAAIEIKKLMDEKKIQGTIKLYGTPAEEDGSGKVYMVRDGLMKDVDVMLEWHPGAANHVQYGSTLAIVSVKFRFHGLSAHAAAAPDKGRSALDAVESLDFMANMMREHIPQDARMHYVITKGGKAPNVVPDFAEVYYFVRHHNKDMVQQIFDRLVNAAKGAALGTGTTMDYEITDGEFEILPNRTLAELMQSNLQKVGGVNYTADEIAFAKKIQSSFTYAVPDIAEAGKVDSLNSTLQLSMASSDVGDVSWNVPTIGMSAATWVPGTPPHSWQAVASGGTDIGIKGLMVAAKTMSLTAIDLFTNPAVIEKATKEFQKARGENFQYKSLVGDRKPPLDIRD
jgi:aminobenzoyl-glutamate utilization protein B